MPPAGTGGPLAAATLLHVPVHVLSSCESGLAFARISPRCLQQLFQLLDRFGVLRADWVVAAAGIRSLQSADHRTRNRERRATVIGFAHEVPLRGSRNVAAKTVTAKSIDNIDGPSFANFCSILRDVELEELPNHALQR